MATVLRFTNHKQSSRTPVTGVFFTASTGETTGAALKAKLNLRAMRLERMAVPASTAAAPPVPSCPPYVLERAQNNTPVEDFSECLLRHGKTLDEGAPDGCARVKGQDQGDGHGPVRREYSNRVLRVLRYEGPRHACNRMALDACSMCLKTRPL